MGLAAKLDGVSDMDAEDDFLFADEAPSFRDSEDNAAEPAWKVLVTDDDDEVHRATAFSLRGVKVDGRSLEMLHASSAAEAESVLRSHPDVAVAFLDVVMETPDAGLRLVETIRGTLGLATLRIVLRTGQAGYAPELEVIRRYDINDYRTKSELTQTRLVTTLTAAVRAYAQLEKVARINGGLDSVVQATNEIFRLRTTQAFARAVLDRVEAMLDSPVSGIVCVDRHAGEMAPERTLSIVHGVGTYAPMTGAEVQFVLDGETMHAVSRCLGARTCIFETRQFSMWLGNSARDAVALFNVERPLTDIECRMLRMFAANLAVGFENVDLIERLDFFAFFDPLTQLPNRTRFISEVDQDLFARHSSARCLAIADVVRFSDINDALGHRCGDSLLVAVSKRLRGAQGPGVRIARVSGDSFGLYGPELAIDPVAVQRAFEAPFFIHGHALSVQMRLGLVRVSDGKGTAVDLLRDANLALNQARKAGGAAFAVHSVSLSDDAQLRVSMLHSLRAAIDFKRGLSVHYQPIVDTASGRVVGAEALLRWRNDLGEMIPPERFVPLAESTGMINELGIWVLETALERLATWQSIGYREVNIAINLSPVQLRAEDFAERVKNIVSYADVPPSSITFEIPEAVGLEDRELLLSHIRAFTEMGIRITIDDFGRGYSSLSQLISLPADAIKIDRRYVEMLGDSDADRAVTSTVISLALQRGLSVVAEGVETLEQLRILTEMGCSVMQGFYFGRSMSAEQFDLWLREYNPI